jgi:hypothetical protein
LLVMLALELLLKLKAAGVTRRFSVLAWKLQKEVTFTIYGSDSSEFHSNTLV